MHFESMLSQPLSRLVKDVSLISTTLSQAMASKLAVSISVMQVFVKSI